MKRSIYSDGKYVYSVDLMIVYINRTNLKKEKTMMRFLKHRLEDKCWYHSPLDVINYPNQYPDDTQRIQNADLKYPIIMNQLGFVIDGMHRLTKAYLNNEEYIDVYRFNEDLMKKFIIGKQQDIIIRFSDADFIRLFVTKFCSNINTMHLTDQYIDSKKQNHEKLYQFMEYFLELL